MNRQQQLRAQNEVVFKGRNNAVKRLAKDLQHSGLEADVVLKFTCECSNEMCRDTVGLTVAQYEAARGTSRQFIVVPGHEQPDIETIVRYDGYLVVEKLEQPPAGDGTLNKTK